VKSIPTIDYHKRLEFLLNNIFIVDADHVFQQTVGIAMDTNNTPLLEDQFV
jgi:hypothetical protein